jgi:hypothetical protein
MKVAIVGSRNYQHLQRITDYVNALPVDTVIISGGASGVDKTAEWGAKLRKMTIQIFPADWDAHGKAAGPIRNKQIVESADRLVAFWTGESKGTRNSIDLATARGIEVVIFKDVEPCCVCEQDATVFSPSGKGYCARHGCCPRCGKSVAEFKPSSYHGTMDVSIYVCQCVLDHAAWVHNHLANLQAERLRQEIQDKKLKVGVKKTKRGIA